MFYTSHLLSGNLHSFTQSPPLTLEQIEKTKSTRLRRTCFTEVGSLEGVSNKWKGQREKKRMERTNTLKPNWTGGLMVILTAGLNDKELQELESLLLNFEGVYFLS